MKSRKKAFLLLASMLIVFNWNSVEAQHFSATPAWAYTNSCQTLRLRMEYSTGRHHLALGAGIILRKEPKDGLWGYRQRAYPSSFPEYFSLPFTYRIDLFRTKFNVDFFSFLDFQAFKSSFMSKSYLAGPTTFDPLTNNPSYHLFYEKHLASPIWALEQNIGIGIGIRLTDQVQIIQMAGVGVSYYDNPLVSGFVNNLRFQTEITGPLLSFGVKIGFPHPAP